MKEGDTVIRFVAGTMPTELEVTHVTNDRIVCADWEFDRISGAEIDELLGWGPPPQRSGSFIIPKTLDFGRIPTLGELS